MIVQRVSDRPQRLPIGAGEFPREDGAIVGQFGNLGLKRHAGEEFGVAGRGGSSSAIAMRRAKTLGRAMRGVAVLGWRRARV